MGKGVDGTEMGKGVDGTEMGKGVDGTEMGKGVDGTEMGKGVDGTEMGKGVDGTEMGKGVDGTEMGKGVDNNIIQVIDLCYSINNVQIIKNLNIVIRNKEFTCIQGKIGSGKSTFINLLFGIRYLDSGTILVNNKNIINTNLKQWKENFHFCEQHPSLFNRSIKENIFYGQKEDLNKLFEIADKLKIRSLINKLLNKKNTTGNNLSGGEKQLIILLRIALNPKKIILLDEPTSALDIFHRSIIYKLINFIKIEKKVCIIAISHDLDLLKIADRRVTFSNGYIIEDVTNKINN